MVAVSCVLGRGYVSALLPATTTHGACKWVRDTADQMLQTRRGWLTLRRDGGGSCVARRGWDGGMAFKPWRSHVIERGEEASMAGPGTSNVFLWLFRADCG